MKHLIRSAGLLVMVVLPVVCGCENGLKAREAGALSGAALGAGLGAIIGNQTGSSGAGIAIGSAIGGLSGAIIGNEIDASNAQLEQTDLQIEAQDRQIAENKRLIEELRRRGADVHDSDRGVVVNFPDVLFEFDSARLTSQAERTVGQIVDVVHGMSGRRISVEGHTDSTGTVTYNQRLSESRARAVGSSLIAKGIPSSRIRTRGFGESDPIASNNSEAGRERNRRVEVIIENR